MFCLPCEEVKGEVGRGREREGGVNEKRKKRKGNEWYGRWLGLGEREGEGGKAWGGVREVGH